MKKILTISDKNGFLIASLEIDWENKNINIISSKECTIQEDEAFA